VYQQNEENDKKEKEEAESGLSLHDSANGVTSPPVNPFFDLVANPSAPPAAPPAIPPVAPTDGADRWQNVELHDILVDATSTGDNVDETDDESGGQKGNTGTDPAPRKIPWWKFWVQPNWVYYAIHPEREPGYQSRRRRKKGVIEV
jgi:hypothetical protein